MYKDLFDLIKEWYGHFEDIEELQEELFDGGMIDWNITDITIKVNSELGTTFHTDDVRTAIADLLES